MTTFDPTDSALCVEEIPSHYKCAAAVDLVQMLAMLNEHWAGPSAVIIREIVLTRFDEDDVFGRILFDGGISQYVVEPARHAELVA